MKARAVILIFFAALLTTKAAETLPRIRVAADGHSFETEQGKPFVPFGVSYYRPGQGWAPQLWKKFDADATRKDFALMKQQGVNCVRVFLTYGSFFNESNKVSPEGLAKFDQFLQIAEENGIYVHPTGPDRWEGSPDWTQRDIFADDVMLRAVEEFWRQFAARYSGRSVIFSYDLLNEPTVQWDTGPMREKWNRWLEKKYPGQNQLAAAWAEKDEKLSFGFIPVPPAKDYDNCQQLLDFQHFREDIADEWTRRQVAVIKAADPTRLVSIGLIQWSVPYVLPANSHYSAFRPSRLAKYLDYLEIHFYPLANGHYDYQGDDEAANLAYAECLAREVASYHKPAIIGEFGWYGGGAVTYGKHPVITEEQQARWCKNLITTTGGFVCGWLNWGFYDQPEANDVSQLTGLMKSTGEEKAWGKTFKELSVQFKNGVPAATKIGSRPTMDWDRCITSGAERSKFKKEYEAAWKKAR